MLRRGDLFAAGIAGAPVSEWRLYDTHYSERYLGDPNEHPDAYDRSSLLPDAGRLSGELLIIHGLADDNVGGRPLAASVPGATRSTSPAPDDSRCRESPTWRRRRSWRRVSSCFSWRFCVGRCTSRSRTRPGPSPGPGRGPGRSP